MTTGPISREQLLGTIVGLEEKMFVSVKASSLSACQQHLRTFAKMRRMSHSVLSNQTLISYLQDLQDAFEPIETTECSNPPTLSEMSTQSKGELRRNFFTEKYARIEGLIPPLKESPVIDEIVATETAWFHNLQTRIPGLLHASGAFEIYEHAELETYSDRTLELYARDIRAAAKQGRNLVEERYIALGLGMPEKSDHSEGEFNVR